MCNGTQVPAGGSEASLLVTPLQQTGGKESVNLLLFFLKIRIWSHIVTQAELRISQLYKNSY